VQLAREGTGTGANSGALKQDDGSAIAIHVADRVGGAGGWEKCIIFAIRRERI
jgi:hypothetical protein